MSTMLMYNHGGCENRGCEAIVRSTSEMFAQELGVKSCLASATPGYDRGIGLGIPVISAEISPYSLNRLINSVGFRLGIPREQEVARRYDTVISRVRRSDVCLSIGGDTYCYGRQEHLLVINGRLRRAGKPIVLWGCSVEPRLLEGERLEDIRQYQLIVARESITFEAMKAAGLPVLQWCDPAFFLRSEEMALPQGWREGGTVGINLSPLVLDRSRDREGTLDAFTALIRHILKTSEDSIALIPHVTWIHDNDLDALEALKARFADEPRVFLLPGTLRAMQLKGCIRRLKALVTARTHASIAGYSTGVPTLVIGYSVKARGIARDLFGDEAGHLIPVQELGSAQQLICAYDALIKRAPEERSMLQTRIPEYTAGRRQMVGRVMELGEKA